MTLILITLLIPLGLYICIRCQRNKLNKGIKSSELRITDIYRAGLGVLKKRDYKI